MPAEHELIDFLQGFVRTPTANPPGDTRAGAAFLEEFLKATGAALSHGRADGRDAEPASKLATPAGRAAISCSTAISTSFLLAATSAGATADPWSGASRTAASTAAAPPT